MQQFTLQELAKFKVADPDDIVSVRVDQIVELIEQKEQISRECARISADNVRLEEEVAEYKSNVAVLEQRISDVDRSSKLNSHNSRSRLRATAFQRKQSRRRKRNVQKAVAKNPIASLVVNLVIRERPRTKLKIRIKSSNIFLTRAWGVV